MKDSDKFFNIRAPRHDDDAESERNMIQAWHRVLAQNIQISNGARKGYAAPKAFKFWESKQCSIRQFYEQADTFDVILFRCNTGGGKIIRSWTHSEWDHVGMVLKIGGYDNEIIIIEATGNRGVHLKKFSSIIPHIGKFYEKVAWKKMNFVRDDEKLDIIDKFVEEAIGRKYKFRVRDLARSATKKFSGSDGRQYVDEDRTFFCSELVAKAWKCAGVMEDNADDGANNFMPADF